MVNYVGKVAEDTSDLSELGLFRSFKNVKRKHEGKYFDATKGDIAMHVDGKNMLFIAKKPVSGTVEKITVKVGGDFQYSVDNLHLKLTKMQSFFKGNFEPKMFSSKDKMTGSSSDDKLSSFAGADKVTGGGGDDKIVGGKGPDNLNGDAGSDIVLGSKGNDLLDGGSGQNSLTGGAGKDTFLFDAQLNAKNSSSVTDFARGKDTLELEHSVFPGLGGKGTLTNSHFITANKYAGEDHTVIYDKSDGSLLYSVNGGSIANAFQFGDVSIGLNLTNKDFFVI